MQTYKPLRFKLLPPGCFVYLIAWARGQLRINFTRIFKVFPKLPESRNLFIS